MSLPWRQQHTYRGQIRKWYFLSCFLLIVLLQIVSLIAAWLFFFATVDIHHHSNIPIQPSSSRERRRGDYPGTITITTKQQSAPLLPSSVSQILKQAQKGLSSHNWHRATIVLNLATNEFNRSLVFIHIGKSGGTSFDAIGGRIARESHYDYVGHRHFDWNQVEQVAHDRQIPVSEIGNPHAAVQVVTMLRHPMERAQSHFYFWQRLAFAQKDQKIRRNETFHQYLWGGSVMTTATAMRKNESSSATTATTIPQRLLESRDIWQDGQAAVSWLTGTHIGNWAGCPPDQVPIREALARNATHMCLLAAQRLNQVVWFGLLDDVNRSMELLQHTFGLTHRPVWNAGTPTKRRRTSQLHPFHKQRADLDLDDDDVKDPEAPTIQSHNRTLTDKDRQALASLMPQDLWLYEYAQRLFQARWHHYQTGLFVAPEYPPLPDSFPCVSTRFSLNCTSGPYRGYHFLADPITEQQEQQQGRNTTLPNLPRLGSVNKNEQGIPRMQTEPTPLNALAGKTMTKAHRKREGLVTEKRGTKVRTQQRVQYKRSLVFMHIGKAGGTSFEALGSDLAKSGGYEYVGRQHFDWNRIEREAARRKETTIGGPNSTVQIVMFLRDPIRRAESHFYFWQHLAYLGSGSFHNYLLEPVDKEFMLQTRDIWQDGQAGVSWLTGTHIANWVGCPRDQVAIREQIASNATHMCLLAAERLNQVKWFGILDDMNRSMELLQHEFGLVERPSMRHMNQRKTALDERRKMTIEDRQAVESLIPQDLWLFEYATRLFEARWQHYKTGVFTPPDYPPLPDTFTCQSTRFELNCSSGPYKGYYRASFADNK